ncbi:MAG: hypothetical protein IK045_06680 [Bacteroidales bacterium]|nr:hypothetical protein [Bacteroidales bacterium]
MNKDLIKKIALALGVVLFFLVLSYAFVLPVLSGKVVNQSDISGHIGMSREMVEWNNEHPDDPALWTGAMFSGMPTVSIAAIKKGDLTQPIYDLLLLGKRPATYLFVALLGAFLLMLSLGVNWIVALGGAVAVAFCSYNFQIIEVGHNTKMQAIAFMPWVLAALIFTYKKSKGEKWLPLTALGAALFGIALSLQVKANHQQITYYLAIMVFIYALVELIAAIKSTVKTKLREPLVRFAAASGLLLVLGLAGVAANMNKLLPLYEYTAHTMRGGSELRDANAGDAGGLDIDYATAWSYGWEELPNLMIPNFNGGASAGAVNPDKSATIKLLKKAGQVRLRETAKALPMYWGPQPFTAGPMYMGAITVFLFVLGLALCRGREKWWVLATVIFAVLLGVGSHFMAFTKLCFKVLPMYSKFRTVSMALIILQVALPVLGFLALDGIVKGRYTAKEIVRASLMAFGVTGGFCLLVWIFPGIAGSFSGSVDAGQQDILVDAFIADRKMLFRQDAITSFLLITVAFGLILWMVKKPKGGMMAAGAIGVIVLINMFAVGKRYLNEDDFITPKDFRSQFNERPVDAFIKEDPAQSYRVLDLTVNVFNDSHPCYHHKCIGGYSPAKLQRYQDIIDRYLTTEINSVYRAAGKIATISEMEQTMPQTPVLDALNMKYVILGAENAPAENHTALGNAWFVSKVAKAESAEEEIGLVGKVALDSTAVLRAPLPEGLPEGEPGVWDEIHLAEYTPNTLTYEYSAERDALAVFSEVFYDGGWKAWLDGDRSKKVEVFAADWILRGALLPKGDHTLTMSFEPSSYRTGKAVSLASSLLLLLTLIGLIPFTLKKKSDGKNS